MMAWLRKGRRATAPGAPAGKLRPARDVLAAERDGVTVLLDLNREVYLTLDEAGTVIWQEVERGGDRRDITARLAAEFDAPADLLDTDADRFLSELESRGLVVRA